MGNGIADAVQVSAVCVSHILDNLYGETVLSPELEQVLNKPSELDKILIPLNCNMKKVSRDRSL